MVYQPAAGFSGDDQFSYTIADGNGGEDSASVSIYRGLSENRPPVANPDEASGPAGEPIVVDVLANDFDPDGGRADRDQMSSAFPPRTPIS